MSKHSNSLTTAMVYLVHHDNCALKGATVSVAKGVIVSAEIGIYLELFYPVVHTMGM